jgi:uncharacterized protein YutE (UPF0331/DUF86 family)
VVRPDVVRRKIIRATAWLERAEKRVVEPRGELLTEEDRLDLVSFHLQLAIQECIDLAIHAVADEGIPPPDEVGSAFDVLADQGILDRDLASRMRRAVGLRNRIVHGYVDIDHGRLQEEFEAGAASLRQFLALMAEKAGL